MLELPYQYSWADTEATGLSGSRPAFRSFSHTVRGSNRVFAFLGHLHIFPEGRIVLRDLLVALSCACRSPETPSVIAALGRHIEAAGWVRDRGTEGTFRSEGFELSLRSDPLQPGLEAVHFFLRHGSTEHSLGLYLGRFFPPHAPRITPDAERSSLPTESRPPTQTPRFIPVGALAERLRTEPCTVLTGAGISLASGIPPFRGPGSLGEYFRVEERFPGGIFDWAVQRPAQLGLLLGSFQAALLTARPNAAHRALAELERRGLVKQVLSSNFDQLHQGAGSVRVQRLRDGESWLSWLSGRLLVVIGAANDAFGVVRAARAAGMEVAVLNPEVPDFVQQTDLYLPGRAEDILPALVEMLGSGATGGEPTSPQG